MQRGFCPIPACKFQSKRDDLLRGNRQSNIFFKFMLPLVTHFGPALRVHFVTNQDQRLLLQLGKV